MKMKQTKENVVQGPQFRHNFGHKFSTMEYVFLIDKMYNDFITLFGCHLMLMGSTAGNVIQYLKSIKVKYLLSAKCFIYLLLQQGTVS